MNHYAVFDAGGSSVKYALMNKEGQFLRKGSFETPKDGIQTLIDRIENIVTQFQEIHELSGIALSMPGAVDIQKGIIGGGSAIPYIHGPNIRDLITSRIKLPVELENDANCAALAEGWYGAAKDVRDYICIVIGSGVGGAIVLNKKIRHGRNLHAGEFGFMIMEAEKADLLNTSWSSYASTAGLIKQTAARIGTDPAGLNGKIVFEIAENGNLLVQDEINKFYKRIAVGIFNLQYSIDPEKILIGGAISQRPDLIQNINRELSKLKSHIARLDIKVESCKFGNDSNLIGALCHFLQRQDLLFVHKG